VHAELLAAIEPHRQAEPWRHVGGYLGRSLVLRSGEVVVKCFLHAAASKWQRELRAFERLSGTGLPVPRLIAAGRLASDVPWLAMTALPGVIARDVLDELPVAAFADIGALLARLHALPVAAAAPRMALRVRDDVTVSAHRRTTLEIARSWAGELLHTTVCTLACTHGDFSPRNLLFDRCTTGWQLSGLIDFEHFADGDPAVDFARMRIAIPRWDDPGFTAFLDGYAAIAPLPTADRVRVQLAAIVLDAATWAADRDLAYYDSLLDLVEKIDRAPDALR
jgi:aminoglycoside phosphotransferase (APT) family kinase protein